METITLALLLLAAVLVSSILDQIIPKVSTPLIQIALGIVIAFIAGVGIDIDLDPEIFLVLFIAPLLYYEAKNTDKASLWRNKKPVLSLAIGLVVVTTLVIGFSVNLFIPSIPLAAAFALGAALGPTDAVAVSSLSKEVDIPAREKALLRGELLLNDASGIVSFQFALAAAITGTFSLVDATFDFLVEFVGGLIFGAVLGLIVSFIVRKVRDLGVENTTFHVLLEVFTPFLIYLISDSCHVSGIIAVVVAGLINIISPLAISPAISRMNIVSSSVWRVLAYALNGVVFVLLGTQLPNAMRHTWDDVSISNSMLILYVLGITFVLLGIRFIWIVCMEIVHIHSTETKRHITKDDFKRALVATLCGAKGTITLSILFTIPVFISYSPIMRFPQRDLIIFLACGVILCTLLLATFAVPLLAPKKTKGEDEVLARKREVQTIIDIMRTVIEELNAHQTRDNRRATQIVIKSYNERISRLKNDNGIADELNVDLRIQALHWEQERTVELLNEGMVSALAGYRYLSRLERVEKLLHHGDSKFSPRRVWFYARAVLRRWLHKVSHRLPDTDAAGVIEEVRMLQVEAEIYVIKRLEEMLTSDDTSVPTEDVSALLLDYQRSVAAIKSSMGTVTSIIRVGERIDDIKRYAYQCELEQVQQMYEEERLTRASAKRLRENIYMMQLDLDDHV